MRKRCRESGVVGMLTVGLIAGMLAWSPATVAYGEAATVFDGVPTQEQADRASNDPDNSGGQAGWADMSGGLTSRPYVRSLSLTNAGTTTPVITGGGPSAPTVASGGVSAVVSPVNLCRVDQTPTPGVCYATPNRVSLTVVYANGGNDGYNFDDPQVSVTPTVDANTVIDMTVALNTLGRSLRWTWVNGDLLYWQTTNLGQADATVRIKFKPAYAPFVDYPHWPSGNGCTATPIFNCNLPQAEAETLSATVLFSLDNTLDPALTGAVFATRGAIAGYLQPGGTSSAPTLDIQAASTHRRVDGTPQYGTVQAFLPAGALINLYGVLPADAASFFNTTRTGDAGTNDPPVYTPWTAAANGSEGVLVTVGHVTFSVPRYKIKGRLAVTTAQATVRRTTTTVTATVSACTAKAPCVATVYKLGASARYQGTRSVVLTRTVRDRALSLELSTRVLDRNNRYLLVVRASKTGRTLASTIGTVH
jgi:hypothetical protein